MYLTTNYTELRFMLDLSKEQKIQYEKKVKSMAEALGFKV